MIKIDKDKWIVYILLCLGCFTISFNVAAIAASVPAISLDLKQPDFIVAKIIPYYLMPYGLGALLYAPLTRFVSYKKVLVFTMICYGLSCFMCARAESLEVLLLGRMGMGVTAASAIPVGLMMIGEFYDKNIRGRLVGFFFSNAFLASIVGLCVAGLFSWRWIFYVPAVMAMLMVCFMIIYPLKLFDLKHVGNINYLKVLSKIDILKVFGFIFTLSFLYHGVHKWYGVYLSKVYGFDKWTISLFFILTVVGGMIGQMTGGILSDKKGRIFVIRFGLIGLSLSVMFLVGFYSRVVLGLVLFLVSIFWTIGHNGVSTALTDFSDEDRPVIASLNSSVRFISGGLGFFVSRIFVESNFSSTFFAIGVLMFLLSFFINRVIPTD